MASPSQNFTPRLYHGVGPPLPAGLAFALYGLAVAVFFTIGLTDDGLPVATIAELIGFALVPILAMRAHGAPLRELGLTRPPLLAIAGAAIVGLALWIIALRVAIPIIHATHREEAAREVGERLAPERTPLVAILAANALVPALCEELLHRGLLLGALAPRLGRAAAIAIAALLFALLHLEPGRMAAAAVLGLGAGVLATWARSVWPAIVLHATNNAVAILVARGAIAPLSRAIDHHANPALAIAIAICAAGFTVAGIGKQQA